MAKKQISAQEAKAQLAELESEKTAFLASASKKGMWSFKYSNGEIRVGYPNTVVGRTLKNQWEALKCRMARLNKLAKE